MTKWINLIDYLLRKVEEDLNFKITQGDINMGQSVVVNLEATNTAR